MMSSIQQFYQDCLVKFALMRNSPILDDVTTLFKHISKPVTQLLQSFREGKKASLLIFCAVVGISETNTGKDPCFVDIKSAAVVF